MSHSTISATRDYLPGHDKGEMSNPAQSASFTVDPLLVPIRASQLPKPMHPDPTPSDNPEQFDPSTRHPNSHYHPEAKLSKKKRAKKLGTGYVAKPHGGAHGSGGVHAGGRSFGEHEKEAHERAERRDEAIAPRGEEVEEEWEEEDDEEGDELQEEEQSHSQHAENRITGTETAHGKTKPTNKRNDDVADKLKGKGDDEQGDDSQQQQEEGGDDKADEGDSPSLMQRATNVLSTAQQRASDVAGSVTSTVLSTAQSVPVVGSLLSKMGLGSSKSDDKSAEQSEGGEEGSEEAGEAGESEQSESSKQTASGAGDSKPVGGQKEKDTEAVTKGAGAQATTEAATKSSTGETYGKQAGRADNSEGALDKSRSQAGQKDINAQAKKEEEA